MTDALRIAEEALRNLPRYEIDQDGGSDLDSIGQWVKFDDLDPIIEAVALSRSTAGDEARDADAARYRWLRTAMNAGFGEQVKALAAVNEATADDMDRAIDAAIAAGRGKL